MRPSFLAGSFFAVTQLFPRYRPALWAAWYDALAQRDTAGNFLFMNYGYVPEEGLKQPILESSDEPYRYCIQLYAHALRNIKVESADVLEVGSGRGGGGSFCVRYLKPKSYIGVDLSASAIEWCLRTQQFSNTKWIQGRADSLPLPDASVDIVLNVESSHSYPSIPDFLSEVVRVLRPGGSFAWCDIGKPAALAQIRAQMSEAGLVEADGHDITSNVLTALERVTPEREAQISSHVPEWLRHAFRDFAGVRGSVLYRLMREGGLVYQMRLLRKPTVYEAYPVRGPHTARYAT